MNNAIAQMDKANVMDTLQTEAKGMSTTGIANSTKSDSISNYEQRNSKKMNIQNIVRNEINNKFLSEDVKKCSTERNPSWRQWERDRERRSVRV